MNYTSWKFSRQETRTSSISYGVILKQNFLFGKNRKRIGNSPVDNLLELAWLLWKHVGSTLWTGHTGQTFDLSLSCQQGTKHFNQQVFSQACWDAFTTRWRLSRILFESFRFQSSEFRHQNMFLQHKLIQKNVAIQTEKASDFRRNGYGEKKNKGHRPHFTDMRYRSNKLKNKLKMMHNWKHGLWIRQRHQQICFVSRVGDRRQTIDRMRPWFATSGYSLKLWSIKLFYCRAKSAVDYSTLASSSVTACLSLSCEFNCLLRFLYKWLLLCSWLERYVSDLLWCCYQGLQLWYQATEFPERNYLKIE